MKVGVNKKVSSKVNGIIEICTGVSTLQLVHFLKSDV